MQIIDGKEFFCTRHDFGRFVRKMLHKFALWTLVVAYTLYLFIRTVDLYWNGVAHLSHMFRFVTFLFSVLVNLEGSSRP